MHELLEEWEDWYRAAGASDDTVHTRLVNIRLLCASAGTDDPVSITTRQIVRWLASCNKAWTRSTYATSARVWFGWLVDRGYRNDNPMDPVPVPKRPRGAPRPAPSDAVRDVLLTCSRRARAYIELATFQGLRCFEIAQVRGEDFNEGWQLVHSKGGEDYTLPIHPMVEMLRRGHPETGYWFRGRMGAEHVTAKAVSTTVSAAFHRQGYPVTAHMLRHWYGTHAQRVGKDIRSTQRLMRHASLSSTQIYTEVADLGMQETVRRLAV